MRTIHLAAALAALLATAARGEVRLPSLISDHMVLQRESDAAIWGWAAPGEEVTVSADWPGGTPARARARDDGTWSLKLRTPGPGGPHTVTITGANTIRLEDVMVGDVWICSGQSNMEWPVARARDAAAEIAAANHPAIRQFGVPKLIEYSPQTECGGQWQVCSPDSAGGFTAVGYFFGRELHRELDVPVGLINASWGGTVAEAWTGREAIEQFPEFAPSLAQLRELGTAAEARAERVRRAREMWWLKLDGASRRDGDPTTTDFDDSSWSSASLPAPWDAGGEPFDGVVWYRRSVELIPEFVGKTLQLALGPIDDMDTVWFDDVRVGGIESPGYWNQARHYAIPAEITTSGPHTLTVRVVDTGGTGGFTGSTEQVYLKILRRGEQWAPKSDPITQKRQPLAGEWKTSRGPALRDLGPWPADPSANPNQPTVLFNGMISPVIPYGIRGAIWYQGEANRGRAAQYRTLFPALIADWRGRWGLGDFPFYFVQLAPYRYGGDTGQTAEIREAQLMTLSVPNTGMAVTMDIGNPGDIHPDNKQEVGRRLALWALARTYGRSDLVYSGPLFAAADVEGSSIRVRFDHAQGLMCRGEAPSHFEIAGPDGAFHPAQARIDGETIIVSSPEVPNPVAARYAWGDADEPNLFNGAGLPASPFRTATAER